MASNSTTSTNSLSLYQISSSLQQATTKKQNLCNTFECIQPSYLATFNLQWSDLDSYFSSLHTHLESRLNHLQLPSLPNHHRQDDDDSVILSQPTPPIPRPELATLCTKMDGFGLRQYLMAVWNKPITTSELVAAFRFAPDPAQLVVEALQRFYPTTKKRKYGWGNDKTCELLLGGVWEGGYEVKPKVKEEAKKLALDWNWKRKVSVEKEEQLNTEVYVMLLATFGLGKEFDEEELLDLLVLVAKRDNSVDVCKKLGLDSRVPDLINKFNSMAQQIYAVKFAHEFELLDVFPPVPLLEAYLKESKKVVQEVLDKGNHSLESQNEAIAREIFCLESMIKCIYKYNLETQFPCASLQKRIEEQKSVRKQVYDQKRFAKFRRYQQRCGNKRSRRATSNAADINMSTNAPSSVNHLQHKNYVPELAAPYLSLSAHLGLVGTDSTIARYLSAIGPSGTGWD